MEDSQRIYNIILLTAEKVGIKPDEIRKRSDWDKIVNDFTQTIAGTMSQLKYFGFKDYEIEAFTLGVKTSLDSTIFLYIMKKVGKETKDPKQFQKKFAEEWQSPQLLDYLDDITNIVLDDFFVKKGGICFTS